MKNLINKVSVLLIALSLFACTEGNKVIDQVLNDTEIGGGVLRTLTISNPTIALGNAASKFSAIVEVQDVNQSKGTEKIDVYVRFKDNNPADGNASKAEVLLKSIPASSFVAGSREFMNAAIDVTITEFKSKLAISDSQYTGGDQFIVRLAQVMKDGKVFTSTNAAGTVTGGAFFNSPFTYNVNVVCPITESLAGTHTYVTNNMKAGGATLPGTVTGTVVFTETSTAGVYTPSDLSFGMFEEAGYDKAFKTGSSKITWFCNNLVAGGTDQYGDSYTYTIIAASGNSITINWVNTYNDSGTTVLTRQGGANWPTIFNR
jgi:hypothetical protein